MKYRIFDADNALQATAKDASTAVRICALLGERACVRLFGRIGFRQNVDGDADESIDAAAKVLLDREAEYARQAYEKHTRQISEARCEQEEAEESGDLEDRLDAAFKVADLERRPA